MTIGFLQYSVGCCVRCLYSVYRPIVNCLIIQKSATGPNWTD